MIPTPELDRQVHGTTNRRGLTLNLNLRWAWHVPFLMELLKGPHWLDCSVALLSSSLNGSLSPNYCSVTKTPRLNEAFPENSPHFINKANNMPKNIPYQEEEKPISS